MSALQRLQEFRFKKEQAKALGGATSTSASSSTSSLSAGSSNSSKVHASSVTAAAPVIKVPVREPKIYALASDSDSEGSELTRGVTKLSTNSPVRRSPNLPASSKLTSSTNNKGFAPIFNQPSSAKPRQPTPPALLRASSSTPELTSPESKKVPFKKLVSSFRYTGEGAPDQTNDLDDSDLSLSSLDDIMSDNDVTMAEPSTSKTDNKNSVKRQIDISSDSDSDTNRSNSPPRRRLMKKSDMSRTSTPDEAPKRRRLVKKVTVLESTDDEASNKDSASPSAIVLSDDDDQSGGSNSMDHNISKLMNTFPDLKFEDIKQALSDSNGDYARAASKLVSGPSDLFSLDRESSRPAFAKQSTANGSGSSQRTKLLKLISRKDTSESPARSGSPASPKLKVKRSVQSESEDSGESFDDNSDCESKSFRYQDRKEERALQFFNDSTLLEMRELTGCSKAQATGVLSLRPFSNYDQMCVVLRKTKGVGEKIVYNYLTTSDAIRAVDMMLKTVDRVRQDLVGTLSIWLGDENKNLFEVSNSSNSMRVTEIKEDGAENENADEDEDPGMELLEIDAEKLEQTEEGKKAMEGFIRKQPDNMAPGFKLKGYQLLGINWLALLWRKKLSGILADEMGLGKTAQVITFLAHLFESGEKGPFLIIVPSSTLSNWMREFEKFCPELDVRSYYGSQAEREEMRYELDEDPSYNVVVTTYTIATGNNDERKFLNKRNFKGIVLDEGHMVKNCNSARYKQLMSIKTSFRLLLTGTPLQNNLEELLSLLIFIMPKLFAEHEEVLRTMFKVKVDATSEKSTLLSQERISRARHMIAPFVLRRKKIHVLKDLPSKVERVIFCDLSSEQQALYDRIMSSNALQIVLGESDENGMGGGADLDPIELDSMDPKAKARALKKKASGKQTAAAKKAANEQFANMLMQLRKAALHPMLFREKYTDDILKKMAKTCTREVEFCDSNIDYIEEDMSVMTDFELHRFCLQYKSVRKFALPGDPWMDAGKVQELERLLPTLIKKDKSRILIFSQFTMMLTILESVLQTMKIKYLRMDGQTKVDERQPMIDSFNDDTSYKVFILSTKAGGFGINLTGANVVIMYDQDFNPQNDKQAEDRAHRVGQTREVEVIKLISKGTVEEQIYQLANLKLKLDQHVSEDGAAKAVESSSSGSSVPSAGLLSLIKQNLKATQAASTDASKATVDTVGPSEKKKSPPSPSLSLSSSSSLSSADSP
ncbi:hypothetical protein BG006_005291 [Podila minutissima]|uniref:DNA helicase n=1 Tax=Podila minutissima TaxID=64525 RepID=A0A9P5VM86_9FUNG|nr:hypothetical protein BG006_005291 [Podila minutissima]